MNNILLYFKFSYDKIIYDAYFFRYLHLYLMIWLGVFSLGCSSSLNTNDYDNKAVNPKLSQKEIFLKEFEDKYGYEWGIYGFNEDSSWESLIDDRPEILNDLDDGMEPDAEQSNSGQKD